MAVKLRRLDTAKGLQPAELELINYNWWCIEEGLNSVGASTPVPGGGSTPGSGPTSNHHLLTHLTDFDDHPQYIYGNGRSGGQILYGGTDPNDFLTLYPGKALSGTQVIEFKTLLAGATSRVQLSLYVNNVSSETGQTRLYSLGGPLIIEGSGTNTTSAGQVRIFGQSTNRPVLSVEQGSGSLGDILHLLNGTFIDTNPTTSLWTVDSFLTTRFGSGIPKAAAATSSPRLLIRPNNFNGTPGLVFYQPEFNTPNFIEFRAGVGITNLTLAEALLSYIDNNGAWNGPISPASLGLVSQDFNSISSSISTNLTVVANQFYQVSVATQCVIARAASAATVGARFDFVDMVGNLSFIGLSSGTVLSATTNKDSASKVVYASTSTINVYADITGSVTTERATVKFRIMRIG